MATPWLTSDSLIEAVKRKISFPLSQNTMDEDDILAFANEEMDISQVPAVLSYHEEYFVFPKIVPLEGGVNNYPIPDRAIGMKLRDLFYMDTQGNLVEMTRISSEDKAYWQASSGADTSLAKFYFQNNDIVLAPSVSETATGSLRFEFFIRPNRLVRDSRAASIAYFTRTITVDNTTLIAGDTVTFDEETILTAGTDFAIGGTSALTATNLAAAITAIGFVTSVDTAIITVKSTTPSTTIESSNATALAVQVTQSIEFVDTVPENITSGSKVDFLQRKPGHKIVNYDIVATVSGNTMTFAAGDIPSTMVPGDYVCAENECIIPMIPPELHTSLSERVCARILAAIGQVDEVAAINAKIQENDLRTGTLIDNRGDGTPQKIAGRKTFLHYNKMGSRRRY